jgi:hypothetical protein
MSSRNGNGLLEMEEWKRAEGKMELIAAGMNRERNQASLAMVGTVCTR